MRQYIQYLLVIWRAYGLFPVEGFVFFSLEIGHLPTDQEDEGLITNSWKSDQEQEHKELDLGG